MVRTNPTQRLFGGFTLLDSLRSPHLGERSELDGCSHQTVWRTIGFLCTQPATNIEHDIIGGRFARCLLWYSEVLHNDLQREWVARYLPWLCTPNGIPRPPGLVNINQVSNVALFARYLPVGCYLLWMAHAMGPGMDVHIAAQAKYVPRLSVPYGRKWL